MSTEQFVDITTEGLRQRKKISATSSPTNSVISSTTSDEGGQPKAVEEKLHHDDDDDDDDDDVKKPASYCEQLSEKSILERLFSSKEERNSIIPHIHKILGFSCLGSFVYRFAYLGWKDGNFGPHYGTLFFILHHWLLNVSAFIFVIPQRRIRDGGFRIWPEYRIHSLVFASRALAYILLRWYEQTQYIPQASARCLWHMDIIIVLVTCALADFGSYLQGKNHSNTVREATFSDPFEQWFASEMQLYLTAFGLVGYRRYTVHLLALFIIQFNSFLMTLRRKNVAPHFFLTGCYSMMLVFGFVVISIDDQYSKRTGVAGTFGGIAAILRMGPLHVNKYIMWLGLGMLWWYLRTRRVLPFYNSLFWLYGTCITKLVSTLLGWYKRSKAPPQSRNAVVGYLVFAFHFLLYAYLFYANFIKRRR